MKQRDESGSAFPAAVNHPARALTRREYYAAKAMAAMIVTPDFQRHAPSLLASFAFNMADAMLAVSDQT